MDVTIVNEEGEETVQTMVAKCTSEKHPLIGEMESQDQHPPPSSSSSSLPGPTFFRSKRVRPAVMLLTAVGGEMVGTFLLTLVICSAVSTAVLSGSLVGLWQVAVVCGVGVAVSIYCVSHVCDAHLNPAITLAFAVFRRRSFSWKRIAPYVVAQMLGGVLAGVVLFAFNRRAIALYEDRHGIERGRNSSVITAMMFGEYFPNPSLYPHDADPRNLEVTTLFRALMVEAWTTCILAFVVFALTDESNVSIGGGKNKILAPLLIGLTVSIMISLYGHATQVGMNPARDLGPRLVAACAGWGTVAVPGPRNGFWVYVVGPVLGAQVGGCLSGLVFARVARLVRRWRLEENLN